jgi:hypothetical protein
MENLNREAERRRRRACRRLGTDNPVCCCCGETNLHYLEAHHIAGRAFGNEIAVVCIYCHRKLTDAQKDHPAALTAQPGILERVGHYLLGLGDLLMAVATTLKDFGAALIELAKAGLTAGQGVRA